MSSPAGIQIPSSPLTSSALSYAREHLDPWAYNHISRCLYFGFAIAARIPDLQHRDAELHALAAILHDLGWDKTGGHISPDKRFEVDGANAAREFVRAQIVKPSESASAWDERRLQVLWDAIALHTTPSIALFKEPEVRATTLGIVADFLGPKGMESLGVDLRVDEWKAVCDTFPRDAFKDGVVGQMCGFCQTKPHTTWDIWIGDFGEMLNVEGYDRKGKRFIDVVLGMQE